MPVYTCSSSKVIDSSVHDVVPLLKLSGQKLKKLRVYRCCYKVSDLTENGQMLSLPDLEALEVSFKNRLQCHC